MKTMNKSLAWMMAAAMTLALVVNVNAADSKQRTGKVVRIKGDARYSTGNKVWQPLKVGTVLKSGNIVQTAKDSFVDVVINEESSAPAVVVRPVSTVGGGGASGAGGGGGSPSLPAPDQDVVRILDDSYLVFDSLNATATSADTVTETLLDLKKGSIFGSVKKQAASSRFEVKTPTGVAGIRGTIFYITANKVVCLQGSVIVAYTDAQGNVLTQVVGAGQEFDVQTKSTGAISSASASYLSNVANDLNQSSRGGEGRGRGRGQGRGHDHGRDEVSRNKIISVTPSNN